MTKKATPTQKGVTVWFTGLPCCGKTTVATGVAEHLTSQGYIVERLDGDLVRKGISSDLGFSREDRDRNIERVAYIASLLTKNGVIVFATFVSPYRAHRQMARDKIGSFIEVYARCPLEVCVARDVKGMYAKALAGTLKGFTGISDPYEEPLQPDLVLETSKETVDESVDKVLLLLKDRGFIS